MKWPWCCGGRASTPRKPKEVGGDPELPPYTIGDGLSDGGEPLLLDGENLPTGITGNSTFLLLQQHANEGQSLCDPEPDLGEPSSRVKLLWVVGGPLSALTEACSALHLGVFGQHDEIFLLRRKFLSYTPG